MKNTLGVDFDGFFPHKKGGIRDDNDTPEVIINPELEDRIYTLFRREIDFFGYESPVR